MLRDLVRSAVKTALLPYGALARERRPGITVLNYHRVGGGSGTQIDLPPQLFAWQMRYLKEHCRVISMDEVAAAAGGEGHGDTVAITFDDGYADVFEWALPILLHYGLPATVYLTTRFLEEGVLGFARAGKGSPGQGGRPLSWAQADEMSRSGLITIGTHTHAHADLGVLPPEEVEADLQTADRLIEARLRLHPAHFAYPWGRHSAGARAVVARRYRTAAVGGVQKNAYAAIDLLALRRVPMQRSDGRLFFRLKLGSYLVGEEWFRARADERNARRALGAALP